MTEYDDCKLGAPEVEEREGGEREGGEREGGEREGGEREREGRERDGREREETRDCWTWLSETLRRTLQRMSTCEWSTVMCARKV